MAVPNDELLKGSGITESPACTYDKKHGDYKPSVDQSKTLAGAKSPDKLQEKPFKG